MIAKLINAGQTGVERAALDVALEIGMPCGGWCDRDRLADDGRIPDHYPLAEMQTEGYRGRTHRNVEEADAVLVLCRETVTSGALLTIRFGQWLQKLVGIVDLSRPQSRAECVRQVRDMLDEMHGLTLQVTGPRESEAPGITEEAAAFLRDVFTAKQGPMAVATRSSILQPQTVRPAV